MIRSVLLIAFCLSTAVIAQTSQPATQPATRPVDPAVVAALVADLGADDVAVREAAKQKLLSMGSGVAGELEKALTTTTDPEVRISLDAMLVDLVRFDRVFPTLVTLKLTAVPPQKAVEAIAEQTGVKIGVWPEWRQINTRNTVTIDAKKQPFWPVLMDICCQAGMSPESHGSMGASQIVLSANNKRKVPPAWYSEGFYVILRNASRNHSIQYESSDQKQESFGISTRILVDPRLRITRGARALVVTEAIDEKGNSLVPKGQQPKLEESLDVPSFGCFWLWEMSAQLRYLPEQGQTLKTFKAKAMFEVIDKEEVWEIDVANAAKAEKTISETTITVDTVEKQGDSYRLKLSLKWKEPKFGIGRNPRQENPMRQYSGLQSMLKLVDAKGRAWQNHGGSGGGGGGSASYEYVFGRGNMPEPAGDVVKIILSVPTVTRKVELPIEFKDLPIP